MSNLFFSSTSYHLIYNLLFIHLSICSASYYQYASFHFTFPGHKGCFFVMLQRRTAMRTQVFSIRIREEQDYKTLQQSYRQGQDGRAQRLYGEPE